jgi:hypothetical protein
LEGTRFELEFFGLKMAAKKKFNLETIVHILIVFILTAGKVIFVCLFVKFKKEKRNHSCIW